MNENANIGDNGSHNDNNSITNPTFYEESNKIKIEEASKDLTVNIEKTLHDVDSKLDKLVNKVEMLEKQVNILLSNIQLKGQKETNGDHQVANSENLIQKFPKACLNSPDSLLSSPVLEENQYGSCLLFNDFF